MNIKLESLLLLQLFLLLLLFTCGAVTVTAFQFATALEHAPFSLFFLGIHFRVRTRTAIFMTERNNHDTSFSLLDRRNLIQNSIVLASGLSFSSPAVSEVRGIGTDPAHPIVVIGAGGRVRKRYFHPGG
jgi:hypothetical protein